MDPLSILSVAAAVVQFLDFTAGVLSDTRETYKAVASGSDSEIKLSKVASDFSLLIHNLSSKMSELMREEDPDHPMPEYERSTIAVLAGLCREAKDINRELQGALRKLEERENIRKIRLAAESFVAALKRAWSAEKIQQLELRLDQNRKQTTMAMLVLSWGQAESNRVTMKQFAIDQAELIAQLRDIDKNTREYGQQILQLIRPQTDVKMQEARDILTYAIDSQWLPIHSMTNTTKPEDAGLRIREERLADMVKNSLLFDTINHREESVPKTYLDTFKWVLESPQCAPDGSPLWTDLREWAAGQTNSIYWVSGKAGAGKSTLVKYLASNGRLRESLEKWAGSSELLLATYYSWNAGDSLQKSHKGLLRAILYHCLKRFPRRLIPQIFPNRWALMQLFSPDTSPPLPDWRLWELLSGFRTLLSLADDETTEAGLLFKVAFVIDGLDEFDESENDHGLLVALLGEAATYKNVKILVSSRPWNVFGDAYSQGPSLKLEKLTQKDIELYVRGQFESSPGFSEQRALHPKQAEKLLRDIVQKAQSVFLWVSVVVRSLLVSMQEGDKLSDCQTTLDGLPEDLNRLFLAIWKRTNPLKNTEGAQYFRLLDICQQHNLVPYSLAIFCGDADVPVELDPAMTEPSRMSNVVASLSRRLNSRTRGLLEIRDTTNVWDSRVDYMHRTVKDWVTDNWDMVLARAEPAFDAHLWVLKGEVLRIAMHGNPYSPFNNPPEIPWSYLQDLFAVAGNAASAAADADAAQSESNMDMLVGVLDKLDATITANLESREKKSKSKPKPKHKDNPNTGQRRGSGQNRTTPHGPHWSASIHNHKMWLPMRRLRSRGWEHNDFVRLMAQLSIPQYVKRKVLQNPSVVRGAPQTIPLLLSAVIGGCQDNPETWIPQTRSLAERLDFIDFILSHMSLSSAGREVICKTLAFMREDTFFSRSWDALFIAKVRERLEDRLRLRAVAETAGTDAVACAGVGVGRLELEIAVVGEDQEADISTPHPYGGGGGDMLKLEGRPSVSGSGSVRATSVRSAWSSMLSQKPKRMKMSFQEWARTVFFNERRA
ncbi:hypothetical protein F5Y17DRAFT_24372 [Xylariaceae sp. FL0594]|nr:hypothetical protein F5Y17DRAFT_24372 [Xylariaceae sp. FL0594]